MALIENFDDHIDFRKNLGSRNLAQLDSMEVAYLQTLADEKGRVAGYAQNILCFFYDICYEKELATSNTQKKAMMTPNKNNQEELNNLRYNIVDLDGREQISDALGDNRGEQVIDTRKLKNGVYIIGIYNNNQLKVSKKLVVKNQK